MTKFRSCLLLFIGLLLLASGYSPPSWADPVPAAFDAWLEELRIEARQQKVSDVTLHQALDHLHLDPRVLKLDRHQPEKKITFSAYLDNVLPAARIDKARLLMSRHKAALKVISQRYGVPSAFIVALWGMESNFGENMGNFSTIRSLATLAYDGRRSSFFRQELLTALKILDQHDVTITHMKGSWAGAMGQSQFMPSSFEAYAVDANHDGRRDIWTTPEDVFASIAHYLSSVGWQQDIPWGIEVRLPVDAKASWTGLNNRNSVMVWKALGVQAKDGQIKEPESLRASLVTPDGLQGRAFLVYDNYRTIMTWNRSNYFATAVDLFANELLKDGEP